MQTTQKQIKRRLRLEPELFTRPYLVTWSASDKTRRYASFLNALRKTAERAVMEGRPRDTFEIAHADLGMQFAVFKVHAGGKLSLEYSPELDPVMNKGKK